MTQLDDLRLRRGIDRLLEPWAGRAVPGVAIGVVRDGDLAEHRFAGLASLEHRVPIGPATTFRIASVSKQFTTAAILMLAHDGRLALTDDLRIHLPELPDFGNDIAIAHLMHNTSGIRDMLELARMRGIDLDQPIGEDGLIELIGAAPRLNFPPGSRYLYSNSNFLLLGLIAERTSGMALPEFLRDRIFMPLGMSMTHMTKSVLEPVPGLATGYLPDQSHWGWYRAPHAFPLGGEGGLVSSIEDLALWARNFATHHAGGPTLGAELMEQARFANGAMNGYARGLQRHDYRGVALAGHGGLWPGYKSQFLMAPERGIAIVVLSNNGLSDPYHLALDTLDLLIDGTPGVKVAPPMPPRDELERYVGRWLDRSNSHTVDIEFDDQDRLVGKTWGMPFQLRATSDGRLIASRAARDFVARLSKGDDTMEVEADAGFRSTFERVQPGAAIPSSLTGLYFGSDTSGSIEIRPVCDSMTADIKGPLSRVAGEVIPIEGDVFRIRQHRAMFDPWLDVRAERGTGGRIVRLHIDGGRTRGLIYTRIGDAAEPVTEETA